MRKQIKKLTKKEQEHLHCDKCGTEMIKIPMKFKIKIKLQRVVIFEVPGIFIQLCFAITFKRILNFFCKFYPEFRIWNVQ